MWGQVVRLCGFASILLAWWRGGGGGRGLPDEFDSSAVERSLCGMTCEQSRKCILAQPVEK